MTRTVVEARNLTVSRGQTPVLSDISFEVQEGEVFALLGGNGAGKSTSLLTFLGLLEPTSGEALVFGKSVQNDIASVRGKIAYLPEAATLYPHLSAYENVDYFLSLAGIGRSRADVEEVFDRVSLQQEARDQHMERYSKGMRQKTAIALALLRETPILFLDEPTSGLDPVAIDEFNRLVTNLAKAGTTIVMVTHDVYGACQVAHKIALLRRGTLVGSFEAKNGERIDTETVHAAFAERAVA
ncbi:ABC transporter ATP-binding protein [Kordiimonas aquimaris]|uniref:ABC transporter ATP-binding protein n=1 Tax=Kordiimonas aquimaris TaxID=707591 RepID=UPI0021D2191C|nr:ABC transporter ATP-binding protein [Kordiimonas aquimaris]